MHGCCRTAVVLALLSSACGTQSQRETPAEEPLEARGDRCPATTAPNFAHMLARRAYIRAHQVGFLRIFTYHARGTNELLGTSLTMSTLYRVGDRRFTQSSRRCADVGDKPGDEYAGEPPGSEVIPSAGCGLTPVPAGPKTVSVNGVARTYTLSLPSNYDRDEPHRLVFAFHGLGGNAAQAQQSFGLEQAAGDQAVLVYPDAAPDARAWGTSGPAAEADIALFDELVSSLEDTLCIDRNHIFATGQSVGGFFANTLGCARGEVLRGIAPVGGSGPFVSCDGGRVAALLIAAQDDRLVASAAVESSRDHWLRASSCSAASRAAGPSACVAYEGCSPDYPVQYCLEPTGDQAWPAYAGTAIWDFFEHL